MPATNDQRLKFQEKTASVFSGMQREFGISPFIALVQSAEESNWGLSQLAIEGNNIFSLTPGDQWVEFKNGKRKIESVDKWSALGCEIIYFPTTEYSKFPPNKIHYWDFPGDVVDKKEDGKGGSKLTINRYFRKYLNWDESAWDWCRKIAKQERYRLAYEAAKIGDLEAYAHAIRASGYATDPSYADNLINYGKAIIELKKETI